MRVGNGTLVFGVVLHGGEDAPAVFNLRGLNGAPFVGRERLRARRQLDDFVLVAGEGVEGPRLAPEQEVRATRLVRRHRARDAEFAARGVRRDFAAGGDDGQLQAEATAELRHARGEGRAAQRELPPHGRVASPVGAEAGAGPDEAIPVFESAFELLFGARVRRAVHRDFGLRAQPREQVPVEFARFAATGLAQRGAARGVAGVEHEQAQRHAGLTRRAARRPG